MKNYVETTGRISRVNPIEKGDKDFLYLTVAVDNGKDKDGNNRPASFISWDVWGQPAKFVKSYLGVGDLVCVSGIVRNDTYEKNGEKVSRQFLLANSVEVLAKKKGGEATKPEAGGATVAATSTNDVDISSDDLPF